MTTKNAKMLENNLNNQFVMYGTTMKTDDDSS